MSAERLRRTFRRPGSEWRGAPFWSWNDDLDPQEIRWQIRQMKRAGLGGFFMHSRSGLRTPFMGERWMECIAAAVDEARKQGMHAWLYDEDRWPSGYGGGLVTRDEPQHAAKRLELVSADQQAEHRFAVQREGGQVVSYRRLADGEQPGPGEDTQQFRVATMSPSPWFNDTPYADNMDPTSVRAFIAACYEPYRERFSNEFGRTIPGIFTDEPNVDPGDSAPTNCVPWTPALPAEFQRRRGYDLLPRLPELLSGHPEFAGTRHDLWRTVTELFAEAYCQQLGEWCARNNLELTGHMLAEQDFAGEIAVGGAAMPSLAHMQRPGIDILTEQTRETLTCKQASSVAHQFGRGRTLSETYGTSGWHMTFEAQKWSGDWQTALGINTRCQHLTPYSIRGLRKRDFPPFFFHHEPWWKYLPVVEDYFARACFFTSIGDPVREVLLIHTISSGWAAPPDRQARSSYSDRLNRMAEDLLALHYDFDLGDEIVMAQHGSVSNRQLLIGKAAYKLVVLPECQTLLASTVDLLRQFLQAGGKVVSARPRPRSIEGRKSPELDGLFSHPGVTHISPTRAELEDALRAALPRRISISGEAGREVSSVICHERHRRGASYIFLVNRDREAGHDLTISLAREGGVERWDLESGRTSPLGARVGSGRTVVELHLPATGSAALVLDPAKRPSRRRPPRREKLREIVLKNEWRVARSRENSLVLDRCQWRFGGGHWSEALPVFVAQRQIRSETGLTDIALDNRPQPWVRFAQSSVVPPRSVELRFAFQVAAVPGTGIDLVLESAELFEIVLNGKVIPQRPTGWWLDKSMDRVPLPGIRRGENEIILRCDYRDAPEYELEECYLIGDFGVDRESDTMVREGAFIKAGDWCDQGYPYYAGNLRYGQQVSLRLKAGERAVLKVGPYFAACLAVHVNGKLAGVRGWPPYEFDITQRLKSGRNLIEIEVCGSPRNLLGPNHHSEKRPVWTGPGQFVDLERWVETRNLVPYGLFGSVTLEVLR